MLLGLPIYGYASGVHSSCKIERATYDSVAFPYFAADTHPHHEYPSFPARERTWHPPVCSHAGDDAGVSAYDTPASTPAVATQALPKDKRADHPVMAFLQRIGKQPLRERD
ncbi:hypothetical protein AWV79_00220 [Cupriavidus sp. UYMMa02A]|nr:hypothetical protein AWV80_28005 [Cupriavidus sp. UYMU48A]ODV41226.1 hypothetical protein AWV79_00220 [Cupriavidus sp. UYMMa02A]